MVSELSILMGGLQAQRAGNPFFVDVFDAFNQHGLIPEFESVYFHIPNQKFQHCSHFHVEQRVTIVGQNELPTICMIMLFCIVACLRDARTKLNSTY